MDQGVDRAARPHAAPLAVERAWPADEPPYWGEVQRSLAAYLRACAITDEQAIAALSAAVRRQLHLRSPMRHDDDPAAAAIRELTVIIDCWLTAELGLDHETDHTRVLAARAALFAGGRQDWASACARNAHGDFAALLRASMAQPLPPEAGLHMETQSVSLRYLRLRERIARWLRRLFPAGARA